MSQFYTNYYKEMWISSFSKKAGNTKYFWHEIQPYQTSSRIMFLSVIRTTKVPVKFWILKNYLSPTLKEILPSLAEKYNFQFEYVQYKWPRWLNQQTQKQRIIWGYKILFLDVMFPLDVKKIIFVDTDQIVRADLTELRDMDLKGAPYG